MRKYYSPRGSLAQPVRIICYKSEKKTFLLSRKEDTATMRSNRAKSSLVVGPKWLACSHYTVVLYLSVAGQII